MKERSLTNSPEYLSNLFTLNSTEINTHQSVSGPVEPRMECLCQWSFAKYILHTSGIVSLLTSANRFYIFIFCIYQELLFNTFIFISKINSVQITSRHLLLIVLLAVFFLSSSSGITTFECRVNISIHIPQGEASNQYKFSDLHN